MGFCKWIEKILSMLERMWEETFKFGFVGLFEGVKMPMAENSPTACGRSPLGEGALGRGAKSLIG